jgi:hypothetical protein
MSVSSRADDLLTMDVEEEDDDEEVMTAAAIGMLDKDATEEDEADVFLDALLVMESRQRRYKEGLECRN